MPSSSSLVFWKPLHGGSLWVPAQFPEEGKVEASPKDKPPVGRRRDQKKSAEISQKQSLALDTNASGWPKMGQFSLNHFIDIQKTFIDIIYKRDSWNNLCPKRADFLRCLVILTWSILKSCLNMAVYTTKSQKSLNQSARDMLYLY